MARYTPQHKEATRRRILATAGRRLKADGIEGSGVATLMADAGLTNGAFYSHFASKEELVASVLTEQMSHQCEVLRASAGDPEALADFLAAYLSTAHRDAPEQGCPSGALLDEVARSSAAVKEAYTAGLLDVVDALCDAVVPDDDAHRGRDAQGGDPGSGDPGSRSAARVAALALFASLVGALQLSRAITDPDLSRAVLDHTLATVLASLPRSDGAAARTSLERTAP